MTSPISALPLGLALLLSSCCVPAAMIQRAEDKCADGDGDACTDYARATMRRSEGPGDVARAKAAALKACIELKEGRACRLYAGWLEAGTGVERSIPEAVRYAEKACQLNDAPGCNQAAWILATSPSFEADVAPRSLALVESAIELAGDRPSYLDTQAAALALGGDFRKAGLIQGRAIAASKDRPVDAYEAHQKAYALGKIWREPDDGGPGYAADPTPLEPQPTE